MSGPNSWSQCMVTVLESINNHNGYEMPGAVLGLKDLPPLSNISCGPQCQKIIKIFIIVIKLEVHITER